MAMEIPHSMERISSLGYKAVVRKGYDALRILN